LRGAEPEEAEALLKQIDDLLRKMPRSNGQVETWERRGTRGPETVVQMIREHLRYRNYD